MKKPLLALICVSSFACDSSVQVPSAPSPEPTLTRPSGFATVAYSNLPNPRLFARRLHLSDDHSLFGETECAGLKGDWNNHENRCTLTEDVMGGIQLGPGIELNCDGHSILGEGGGIGVWAADDSRVSNCLIRALDPEEPLGVGVFMDGVTGFTFDHSKVDYARFSVFSAGSVECDLYELQMSNIFASLGDTFMTFGHLIVDPVWPTPSFAASVLFLDLTATVIENSEFQGHEWSLAVINPTDVSIIGNRFEGGFGGLIVDGSGGNVLVAGNRFSNMDLPVQIAVDGHGFLVLDNEFMNTGGSQIGTFPGQTSSGHYYMFNSFHNGRDTDNDFRDMGAVFDGLEDLIFGFNTVRGAVGSGVYLGPGLVNGIPVHIPFNTIRDNGGHGIDLAVGADKLGEIWLNDIRGNAGFQVHLLEPAEYSAFFTFPEFDPPFRVGNYYGPQGFVPGVTSNGSDDCPLRQPIPIDPLRIELFDSLEPFLGQPFPGFSGPLPEPSPEGVLEVLDGFQLPSPQDFLFSSLRIFNRTVFLDASNAPKFRGCD